MLIAGPLQVFVLLTVADQPGLQSSIGVGAFKGLPNEGGEAEQLQSTISRAEFEEAMAAKDAAHQKEMDEMRARLAKS